MGKGLVYWEEIRGYFQATNEMMQALLVPTYPTEKEGYFRLLSALFPLPKKADLPSFDAFLAANDRPPRRSETWGLIGLQIINAQRGNIMPVWDKAVYTTVDRVIDILTLDEKRIIRLRFGIPTGPAHTLEEIGMRFSISAGKVRKIEGSAVRRLRHDRYGLKRLMQPVNQTFDEWVRLEDWGERFLQWRRDHHSIYEHERKRMVKICRSAKLMAEQLQNIIKEVSEMPWPKRVRIAMDDFDPRPHYLFEFVQKTPEYLLSRKNVGQKSLGETQNLLEPMNLRLGMVFTENQLKAIQEVVQLKQQGRLKLSALLEAGEIA